MKKIIFGILLCTTLLSFSFVEKDVKVFSKAMEKEIPVTVVLPDTYTKNEKYSVIYTLHGWSGSNRNFVEKTSIGKLADKLNVIYVSPDGNYDSWYVDSVVNTKSKYETFISKELVKYVDENYSTIAMGKNRAITGLSMGGFGAFYIGINNQNIFGNIGSMSGGVNVEQFKFNWGINKNINSNWDSYNIKDIAHRLLFTKSNIIFDCGVDDFFIEANRELHKKLLELNINHDYIERAGVHNWVYWDNSIKYQSIFFNENFNKMN